MDCKIATMTLYRMFRQSTNRGSPHFGITVTGDADEMYSTNIAVSITMADGTTVLFCEALVERVNDNDGNSVISWSQTAMNDNVITSVGSDENGGFIAKYSCKTPLDIEKSHQLQLMVIL